MELDLGYLNSLMANYSQPSTYGGVNKKICTQVALRRDLSSKSH